MAKHVWQKVNESGDRYTSRMRVEGGWLYLHEIHTDKGISQVMTFVPDSD